MIGAEPLEGWGVYEADDGCAHVAPIKDRREHVLSCGCWCLPRVGDRVVIHEAGDGRK